MFTGWLGCTLPLFGVKVNQLVEVPAKVEVIVNASPVLCNSVSVTDCAAGLVVPGGETNTNPVGCATGAVFAMGAAIFNTTDATCGVFGAPGAFTCTWP